MTTHKAKPALETQSSKQQAKVTSGKIEKALEIRESSSEARKDQPLAFPTRRLLP